MVKDWAAVGRYSVWVYAPRLTSDSLFQIQNEMVMPKQIIGRRESLFSSPPFGFKCR
jgi:hypothetical protein